MKLHEQVKHYKAVATQYEIAIKLLRSYCHLDKFNKDKMINKDDILMRIEETLQDVYAIEVNNDD